jgi:hypothetical protein
MFSSDWCKRRTCPGGYDYTNHWVQVKASGEGNTFLFPVKNLSVVFRGKFICTDTSFRITFCHPETCASRASDGIWNTCLIGAREKALETDLHWTLTLWPGSLSLLQKRKDGHHWTDPPWKGATDKYFSGNSE